MTTLRTARVLALWAVTALVACGGSTGNGGGGGASTSDVEHMCKALCDRETRCNPPASADCESNCVGEVKAPSNIRADFLSAYASCLDTAACTTGEDDCLAQAANRVSPNWQNDSLFLQCKQRYDECHSFSDDNCAGAIYFTSEGRQQLSSCLALDCSAIADCMNGLI